MIRNDLSVQTSIPIKASPEAVWKALTTPALIARYLFGSEVICDWKKGSEIIFQGKFNDQPFRDKGVIKDIEPGKRLEYTYWSAWSGLEDKEQNYSLVAYNITPESDGVTLSVRQSGFADDEKHAHAKAAWQKVLQKIKEICENA